MKSIIVTALLILFALVSLQSYGQSVDKTQQTEAKDTAQSKKIVTYTVYGMDCPGCQGALEKQINKISWVTNSEANWIKQEVKVEVTNDSLLVDEEIYKKIRKANFTPVEKKKKNE